MIKYRLEYNDIDNNKWRVDINIPSYDGLPIALLGEGENVLSIAWGGNTSDDPHAQHVIPSSATLRVYSQGIDLPELMLLNDAQAKFTVYQNSSLFWSGFLISDGIQIKRQTVNYPIQLQAIDGIALLDKVEFQRWTNLGAVTVNGVVGDTLSAMNTIRLIIQRSQGLDNPLPIRWMNNTISRQYPTSDGLAGLNKIDKQGKMKLGGIQTCMWWLNNIIKSQYCWMFQSDGYWYVINYKDLIANNGVFEGWEIPVSDNAVTATAITVDFKSTIDVGLQNDGYLMIKKPSGKVTVTYNDLTNNNNVVPNGEFDESYLGTISDWYAENGSAILSQNNFNLNGQVVGNSLRVANTGDSEDFVTFGSIPLDSNLLFKNANMGFQWMPVIGYNLDSDGNIDFSKFPISISCSLVINRDGVNEPYYLNEFGYWSNKNAMPNAEVTGISYNSIPTSGMYIAFDENKSFYTGDELVVRFVKDGAEYNAFVAFGSSMTVSDGMEYISIELDRQGFDSRQTDYNVFAIQGVNYDSRNSAEVKKLDNYYKKIEIEGSNQMKYNDILDIQFQSKGKSSDIKIPQYGTITDNTTGMLSISIYSKFGSVMNIDNVYFKVSDNHDVYEVKNTTKNGANEYELGISSSFSGHMVSSYMDSYKDANKAMLWSDSKTLTQLYGEYALNWMNQPRRVYQGTFKGLLPMTAFYRLDGYDYISLGNTLNCHNRTTKTLLFEAKNNAEVYEVVHKSSGDS